MAGKIKFGDVVPKVIRDAHYRINVDWSGLKNTLARYGRNYNLEIQTDFQRKYKWKLAQQKEYIESMFKGCMSGRDIYFNCPNWQRTGKTGVMKVVDGQQRLTTILRFTNNKFKVFGKYYYKDFLFIPEDRAGIVFHINNLKTKNEEIDWYVMLNTKGIPHTEEEINRALSCKTK